MNELDFNLSRCLIEKSNITNTIVTNVCNGETYTVTNGAVDYIMLGLMVLLFSLLVGIIMFGAYLFYKDTI